MRTLLESDINEIINLYRNGKTALQICSLFKTGKKRILDILRENNIQIRNNGSIRKYELNENYFKKIDNHNKAQVLGFLFADGCLYNNHLQIQVSKKDIDYLEFIKNELQTNKPLCLKKGKKFISPSNKKEYNREESYCLDIHSSEIFSDCNKLGLIPRKSFTEIFLPDIKNEYINSFILGLFEGDGNIYFNKKHRVSRFNILCQEKIANPIIDIIKKELNIELTKRFWTNTKNGIPLYYIELQRKKDIEKLFNWLYKDSTFYMARKYNIFHEIIGNKAEPIKELIS